VEPSLNKKRSVEKVVPGTTSASLLQGNTIHIV
jgi:hypothetical protein